jgi:glycosyltransferase involved in cell wall biosynthesis
VILTTHPIQYQVPLWQALARDGRVSFEVWYLTDHAVRPTRDREFDATFAWDLDLLSGYPYRFVKTAEGAMPGSFWKCRLREPLRKKLREVGATALWIQGWQVLAFWQAVAEARAAGVEVWLRGESNDLATTSWTKRLAKRFALKWLFNRVERFLYIGAANKRLYMKYDVPENKLFPAPYAVDNDRFAEQAAALASQRSQLRRQWNIPQDAFCVLFCGKLIKKKRPRDLVEAAGHLIQSGQLPNVFLLFAGSGVLEKELKDACQVVFDSKRLNDNGESKQQGSPWAAFVGFLNQTEVSQAYVAADCLALPSDHGETWGLVVNEAMASCLPCVVSDACGCNEDLILPVDRRCTFACGDAVGLASALLHVSRDETGRAAWEKRIREHHYRRTIETVVELTQDKSRESLAVSFITGDSVESALNGR